MEEINVSDNLSYTGNIKGMEVSDLCIYVSLGSGRDRYEIDLVKLLDVDQLQTEKDRFAEMVQAKYDLEDEKRMTVADMLNESRAAEADLYNDEAKCGDL